MEFCMPMLIPKPVGVFDKDSDVKYKTFDDGRKLPLTNEHQPSLTTTILRDAYKKKKIVATHNPPASRLPTPMLI